MVDALSRGYFDKGLLFAHSNKITKAIDHLTQAVCFDNKNTPAWNLLGLCFYRMGKFGMSEHCWKESVKYGDQGTAEDYLEILEDELYTGRPLLQKALARALRGEYRAAYTLLNSDVLEGMAETEAVLNFKGLLKYLEGKKSKAIKLWTESLEVDLPDQKALPYMHYAYLDNMKGKKTL